jgi:hypothetical protein
VREIASSDQRQPGGAETLQLLIECGGAEHANDVISAPSLGIGLRVVHLLSRDNHPSLLPVLAALGADLHAPTTAAYRRTASLPRYMRRKAADGDHIVSPDILHPAGSTLLHMVCAQV